MIKLCKDCVHCLTPEAGFSKCGRTEYVDTVDGKKDHVFCNIERTGMFGCCGPDAKFFAENSEVCRGHSEDEAKNQPKT